MQRRTISPSAAARAPLVSVDRAGELQNIECQPAFPAFPAWTVCMLARARDEERRGETRRDEERCGEHVEMQELSRPVYSRAHREVTHRDSRVRRCDYADYFSTSRRDEARPRMENEIRLDGTLASDNTSSGLARAAIPSSSYRRRFPPAEARITEIRLPHALA